MNRAKFFHMKLADASLEKSADAKRLSVRGYFTSDQRDEVGDIITRGATQKAIPSYRQWGNIRYMHQPRPVGVVTRIGEEDGLEWNEVEFDVTKKDVIEDVENGLLKALSVGILVDWDGIDFLDDGGWIINEYALAEISLVDHPANYDARLKDMDGAQAMAYVKGLYTNGTDKAVFPVEKEETVSEPEEVEKSPACRQEDESKEDCVSRKVPELVDEGMDQEQAVAAANEICSESCADKSFTEETVMEKDLEQVDAVEEVADVELPEEPVATDETSAEKAIDETPELSDDEGGEDVAEVVEGETEDATHAVKDIDGEEINQEEETEEVAEPVEETKDITSDDEIIVEDEPADAGDIVEDMPEWAKAIIERLDQLSDQFAITNSIVEAFAETSEEVSAEAEIEQDADVETPEELDKGLEVDESEHKVVPTVQKGAMPATEIINEESDVEEQPEEKPTLKSVLRQRFLNE